jgi:hypothetical protein
VLLLLAAFFVSSKTKFSSASECVDALGAARQTASLLQSRFRGPPIAVVVIVQFTDPLFAEKRIARLTAACLVVSRQYFDFFGQDPLRAPA